MILSVIGRRTDSVAVCVAAGVALAGAVVAFLTARRTFRRVEVRAGRNQLTAVVDGRSLSVTAVSGWTIDGPIARVYDRQGGWMLRAADAGSLQVVLTGAFGPPLLLRRRGSDPARYAAASVACLGALGTAAGFGAQSVPIVIAGLPLFLFGFAFFGALSQKISDVRDADVAIHERPHP